MEYLIELNNEEIREYREELLRSKAVCDIILKNSKTVSRVEGLDVLGDYVNSLFLVQVRAYYKIMNKIEGSKEELKFIYNILGEMDAFIAIAAYKSSIKENICEAELIEESGYLNIQEAVNPFIISGVPNSIEISKKGTILTGSNMSGKSTFLRTIGINAVLAQTFSFATAKSYRASLFNIMSSISPSDDIAQGKSYYLGEAEAVLRIIKAADGKVTTLCIIDEIFRGTNPIERIASSAEILLYLMRKNALAVVATHDLELTELTKGVYDPYYFSEDVDDNEGISFDFKLKRGVSPTRNAIKLLKFLGYPEEIINKSQERLN